MYRCIFISISNLTPSSFSFCNHEKLYNKYKIIHICFSGDQIKKNESGGACGTYGETGEVHTQFWNQNLREICNLQDLGVDEMIIKWTFKKWDGEARTGLIWLRIETGGGRL